MIERCPEVAAGSSNRFQAWEVCDPEKWVPDGYICVRVDARGWGRSPGFLDPWSTRETIDMRDCIEWAGTQPWSNGKVGLLGISYYAVNQWQVAAMNPPHLAAMIPWEGFSDFYRELSYHGGIANDMKSVWYERTVTTVQHGRGERGFVSVNTGDLVAGPETHTYRRTGVREDRLPRRDRCAPPRRRIPPRAVRTLRQDLRTVAVRRQLGRVVVASARQRGGLRAVRLEPEVAGDSRPRTLDRVLHRLRNRFAEAVFRPLPQRRRQRMGPPATGHAEDTDGRRWTSSTAPRTNGPSRAPSGGNGIWTPSTGRSPPTRRAPQCRPRSPRWTIRASR